MNRDELRELIAKITHAEADVRHAASVELGSLVRAEVEDIGPLLDGLESENYEIAFWCLAGLAYLCAPESCEHVKRVGLTHPWPAIRTMAIRLLSRIAPDDPEVRLAILDMLRAPVDSVRTEAMRSVIRVGTWTQPELDRIRASGAFDSSQHWNSIDRLEVRRQEHE